MHCTQPTMCKFFYFKIAIKTKADSYMPCKAMAHSTKCEVGQEMPKCWPKSDTISAKFASPSLPNCYIAL